jgi:flagellar basal body P-ring protein FlgI
VINVMHRILACLAGLMILATAAAAQPIRLKDLVDIDGVRGNDLIGFGLVVGLDGTGDGLRNAPFTEDAMTNILERLGVNIPAGLKSRAALAETKKSKCSKTVSRCRKSSKATRDD